MTPSVEELNFWENQSVLSDYMIKDRFSDSIKSLDSKNKQIVYKTSNIKENKAKLT